MEYTIYKEKVPHGLKLSQNTITSSDDEISEIYNSIENENLKLIFLYILSIKNQYNNQKRGEQLIQILCGETVKYKKQIYSKGA